MTTTAFLIGWALLVLLVALYVITTEPEAEAEDPAPLRWPCEIANCDRAAQDISYKGRWICRDHKAEIDAHRARIARKH